MKSSIPGLLSHRCEEALTGTVLPIFSAGTYELFPAPRADNGVFLTVALLFSSEHTRLVIEVVELLFGDGNPLVGGADVHGVLLVFVVVHFCFLSA